MKFRGEIIFARLIKSFDPPTHAHQGYFNTSAPEFPKKDICTVSVDLTSGLVIKSLNSNF